MLPGSPVEGLYGNLTDGIDVLPRSSLAERRQLIRTTSRTGWVPYRAGVTLIGRVRVVASSHFDEPVLRGLRVAVALDEHAVTGQVPVAHNRQRLAEPDFCARCAL
jgi:hypothetical protein